ncbi:phosphate ABC transporter substrate-binding protein PstS [Moraxella nasovis]|uniref:phosphate ABC transporter substrate-binding protein PstS n=1 Tax=Moraxella nasovis TaxID=2904121 RepID=UPI001F60DE01|nr:phosphate ABC transporter substrate-binding protein PstS [Moraxella nasovis]UNU72973.1 phosphate ABC transporter substrate-binding protein PstS [Moraxella nasovis]
MKANKFVISALCLSLVALVGCQDKSAPAETAEKTTPQAAAQAGSNEQIALSATGAGASFPQPIYAKWASEFAESGGQINYQSIGSSGGVKQIIAKTVDFGATDSPLSAEELDKEGLIQFPAVIGGVVPIVNIQGVSAGQLKLTGEILAQIYLGEITKWSDPKIKELNPDAPLPDENIVTVFRSDGSGTSFIFTNYLSQVSAKWKETVGADKTVKWPTSQTGTAGKGNEGVATYVGRVNNSIGYVEYAYAKQNNMAHVSLKNQAGQFVQPSQETFAAAADVDWSSAKGFNLILTNQPSQNAWPLAAATFILMHKTPANADNAKSALTFFDYAFKQGDDMARQLDYVPLPASVKDLVRGQWANVVGTDGKAVYTAK